MMKAMQNRQTDNLPLFLIWKWRKDQRFGNVLVNSLIRPTVIEKGDVLVEHPPGMPLAEDHDMVQAFAPNRAAETFTHRIGFRGLKTRVQQFPMHAPHPVSNHSPHV